MTVVLRRVAQGPTGIAGSLLLIFVVLAALGLSWVTPYDPAVQNLPARLHVPSVHPVQGRVHLLGTDQLGRDTLSRLLIGARVSLLVALSVVPLSLALGLAVGLTGGYFGEKLDLMLMRVADTQLAHRGHFVSLEHSTLGPIVVEGSRFRLSRTPARVNRAAPAIGQDTHHVLEKKIGSGCVGAREVDVAGLASMPSCEPSSGACGARTVYGARTGSQASSRSSVGVSGRGRSQSTDRRA